ncbi:MAG TPA: ketoacyl-ACP synthase III [Bacteroidetes bacterium]|nr:ketoacyl-ACP synthase III [Bacteroidota bacterium]
MENILMTGIGSYIPEVVVKNEDFLDKEFYDESGKKFDVDNHIVIDKLKDITGIYERRYVPENLNNSDIGFFAAQKAIEDAGIDPETLDFIIVGQNAGEVIHGSNQSDMIPSIASRIKQKLKIKNPNTIAYDIMFGCPGWLQGVINMTAFLKTGMAKRVMVIGSETLSRVTDPHDRDSMIFADGAGATIFELVHEDFKRGILSFSMVSHTLPEADYLYMDKSYNPKAQDKSRYIKMLGRKIYEYSLSKVPAAMKDALDKSGVDISDVKKVFIHQANEKMDEAIVKRFFRLYGIKELAPNMMPMSINELGNSSVATIPTLIDMVLKENYKGNKIEPGDVTLWASVGAGMNINALVYRF